MKKLFFGLVLLCTSFLAKSQYDSTYSAWNTLRHKMNIKVDVANAVNPIDPSLLLSVEYFLNDDLSLNHEVGIVTEIRSDEAQPPFFGFKTRHEFRWYYYDGIEIPTRFYVSGNFLYRYLEMDDRYTLGFDCDDWGGCEYYKNFQGTIKTDRYSFMIRLGIQNYLTDRIILEVDGGMGFQYLDLRRSSINGGRLLERGRFFEEYDFRYKPHVSLSCKFGFVLY